MQPTVALLVADDDDIKRSLIAQFLLRHFPGADIRQCASGLEAIEQLSIRSADAVVTDNSMIPINGLELTSWIRDNLGGLPIVMVSGNPGIEKQALDAGVTEVLSPLRFLEIGTVLERLLKKPPEA
jgi:CheY-like chemotaxis protein